MNLRRLLRLLSVWLVAGCSGKVSQDATGNGAVTTVENSAPLWGAEQKWIVDPAPMADIGKSSGPREYMLHQIEGVLRIGDGRILVAEFSVNLRYYDSTGKHDTTLARQGRGPGELDLVSQMLPSRGDSIALVGGSVTTRGGGGSASIVILGANGDFGRQVVVRWPSWTPAGQVGGVYRSMLMGTLQGTTSSGSFVVRGEAITRKGAPWTVAPFYSVAPDETSADTIGFLAIAQVVNDPKAPSGNTTSLLRMDAPRAAVHGNRMYYGTGDRFEIGSYDLSMLTGGFPRPVLNIRYALPGKPVDDLMLERLLTMSLAQARTLPETTMITDRFSSSTAAATLPAYQTLRVDSDGNLWVEHQRFNMLPVVRSVLFWSGGMPDDPAVENRWSVFDPEGKLLGDVITPTGLEISQIGRDWMLGMWTDTLGVQHVRLHRIRKSS
jgi:hypothetical protein